MCSFSLLILLQALFLAPILAVPTKSTDDVELPSDPSRKVKVYSTNKTDLDGSKVASWTYALDGGGALKITTGFSIETHFSAYVYNQIDKRNITVTIRDREMQCGSSQTYFAKVTDRSHDVIEQFDFKMFTRGRRPDRWHLLKRKSLQATYVWFRGKRTLTGDIRRQDNHKKVAHIHCNYSSIS
ncbi:hypothetical protein O181_049950 [Austropuccinia psidii MF-1]|uniref:Uncharacterized protein n=1 Tax=Austropuccinia psidii MF-1 TaxID=1389203 RepID=A0A9Q3HQI4_9BASI|nr:hypothetical protein [Austropuccinia psidii MF-1]